MMAWNGLVGQSIPDVVAETLAEPVVDRAVSGARMIYRLPVTGAAGLSIPKQYRGGSWDWSWGPTTTSKSRSASACWSSVFAPFCAAKTR